MQLGDILTKDQLKQLDGATLEEVVMNEEKSKTFEKLFKNVQPFITGVRKASKKVDALEKKVESLKDAAKWRRDRIARKLELAQVALQGALDSIPKPVDQKKIEKRMSAIDSFFSQFETEEAEAATA